MAEVRLLGGVEVVGNDGATLDVGPPKCRLVLAALALSRGEAVPVPRLVDLVWGEEPPRTAPKILQGYVSQLRRVLGASSIARVGAAYRLERDVPVDADRFLSLATAGEVEEALAVWGGTPLAGLDPVGLQPAVDGLVERWLDVVEQQLSRRTDEDPSAAVGPLTELTAAHPFREGLWALLMTALARTDRQADALAAYQRARQHLVEELGIDPGERLRQLEASILAGEAGGAAPVGARAGRAPDGSAAQGPSGTVTCAVALVGDADRLWARHRGAMADAMVRLEELLTDVTARHGGSLLGATGDGTGVVLASAAAAVAWAAAVHDVVGATAWPDGIDVRLRVGLHTGEGDHVEEGRNAPRHGGLVARVAAGVAAAAWPGQTLATGTTVAVLGDARPRSLGVHRVEGIAGPVELHQLDGGSHAPPRTVTTALGSLPPAPELLGRDDDLEVVLGALDTASLVTLVGPGGIGKTTLAVAVAHAWHEQRGGRVALVELDEVPHPEGVVRAVAEALGVAEPPSGDLLGAVVAGTSVRSTLVVLDNCEHVLPGAAALVAAVASGAPTTRVLATSRERLGAVREHLHPVEALDPGTAGVELFVRRARAVAPQLDLDDDTAVVEEVCRRLDGLPLAIELAAARTSSLTPRQLRDRLDDRLRLLAAGGSRPPRRATLHGTVAWSHDLLSGPQQRLFARLSVFTGPFDLAAVEAVAAGPDLDAIEVDRLLGDLVERSMVGTATGPRGRRFRLLETLRQFGSDRLEESGERRRGEQRHADWCRRETARIGRLLAGPEEVDGVLRLDELWPNLRSAVDRAVGNGDVPTAAALVRPVVTEVSLRRRGEIGSWAERILAGTPTDDEQEVVWWLSWALHRHMQSGNRAAFDALVDHHGHADHPLVRCGHGYLYEDGATMVDAGPAAVAWLRDRGSDLAADLLAMTAIGSGLMTTGRLDELVDLASGWVQRDGEHGPPTMLYFGLGMLAYAAQLRGDAEAARRWFVEAAGVEVPPGTYAVNRPAEAQALFEQGERERACRLLRDHVEDVLDAGTVDVARLVAVAFVNLMAGLDRLDDAAPALAYLDRTGEFGVLARTSLVADAARRIGSTDGTEVGAVDALRHMRRCLEAPVG